MDLNGSTCLVTGANRGIGRAIATELARRGVARVLAGTRSLDNFEPIEGVEAEVKPVVLDLGSLESIESGWEALGDEARQIDVLVNNAGLLEGGDLTEQDTEKIYAMVQANLTGLMHLTKLALPQMADQGTGMIVNNASISGYAYFPGATTYAATKAGVVAFSEALRRELKDTGVGVLHLVTPGVETEMLDATKELYEGRSDVSKWTQQTPEEWARRVADAIESDQHVLGPGGVLAVAKLASRGPAKLLDLVSDRMFGGQGGKD